MDAGGRAPTVGALGDAGAVAEKHAWIKQHAADFAVNRLSRLMDVSRSTYDAWLHRAPTRTEKDDQALTKIIGEAFKKSRATYSTRSNGQPPPYWTPDA